jgi:DNA repair photolyase
MKYITRKSLLYKTAVEYGDYTINHVEGCAHGCKYPCYAMMMAKRFGKVKDYKDWIKPKIVKNAEKLLLEELPKQKDKIKFVHMCFSTDPFMYGYDEISELSCKLVKIINDEGIKCTALTKGVLPEKLADFGKTNEFGITLVSLDENFRAKWEPGSAPYKERIKSLRYLHNKGVKTWVSMEPYPTPNIVKQDFKKIIESISFVDKIIFGRLNYNALVSAYKEKDVFYNELSEYVVEYCKRTAKEWHIKEGTVVKDKVLITV